MRFSALPSMRRGDKKVHLHYHSQTLNRISKVALTITFNNQFNSNILTGTASHFSPMPN